MEVASDEYMGCGMRDVIRSKGIKCACLMNACQATAALLAHGALTHIWQHDLSGVKVLEGQSMHMS